MVLCGHSAGTHTRGVWGPPCNHSRPREYSLQMRCIVCVLVTSAAFAQTESASAVMAKAAAAVERNLLQEKHWNWTTVENRRMVAADGHVLEELPSVTVESVIRAD